MHCNLFLTGVKKAMGDAEKNPTKDWQRAETEPHGERPVEN